MKTADYTTSDFRLTFAKDNFQWSEAPRPGLPLLRWPDGTLCEPVLYYFGYSAVEKRVKISSMKPEAYSLRAWFTWLANKGLNYLDANDEILERWRTEQGWVRVKKTGASSKLTPKELDANFNIERKLHHIFEFYRNLPFAMPRTWNGMQVPLFVGNNKPSPQFPIGLKKRDSQRKKREYDVWVRSTSNSQRLRVPEVPSKAELTTLYNYLRGQGFREQQRLKLAFPPEELHVLSERNWLLARTMAAGGLRSNEASILSVADISKALHDFGITESELDLCSIKHDEALKTRIRQRVLSLQNADEFSFILVKIVGKGPNIGKVRHAPFPPSLICDLLDGIWGFRSQQVAIWSRGKNGDRPCDNMFLSHKAKNKKMSSGAIGDIIGKAFRACGIKRGAHSLRAYFATTTAAALWKDYFAQNHYHFDPALVNMVLDNLARFMGHTRVSTTLKFYLDLPLFKHLTKIGTPEAKLFQKLWTTIVMERRALTKKTGSLLAELATRVSESGEDSLFFKALEFMMADPRFKEVAPRDTKSIRLAYDETKIDGHERTPAK